MATADYKDVQLFFNSEIIFVQHSRSPTLDDLRCQKPRAAGLASAPQPVKCRRSNAWSQPEGGL